MTQERPSETELLQGGSRDGGAEPDMIWQRESLEPYLLPPLVFPNSSENQPQIKRDPATEDCESAPPKRLRRVDAPSNHVATGDHPEPSLPASLDGTLCLRCKGLDLDIPKDNCPSFKLVARLGSVNQLLNSPECPLCQLVYKVRPVPSKIDTQDSLDCSLVLFDGRWARPWIAVPSSSKHAVSALSSRALICFDTFAEMDNEIMLGVLFSNGANDPRSNRVPYLHDRLYRSLTKSGYIRVIQGPSRESFERNGPKAVGSDVNWDFLRTSLYECTSNHSSTCGAPSDNDYRPLKVIDCQSRKVITFPRYFKNRTTQYLALSYVWGSEQAAECTNRDSLPDTIPTTISDAMEATFQLGFLFLWVDRYCIPQNNDSVKHREIRYMDLVYRGAVATIVACSGTSPWYGLPGCSSRLRPGSNHVAVGDQSLFSVPPDPRYEIKTSNWMGRGWTYQEGLLSRRRIFFTEEQAYFECDARHCFESTAPLVHEVLWEGSQNPRIFSIGGKAICRRDFYKTVNEYSGRKLTYESDILNGVWGVLRTFSDAKLPIRHYWGVPIYASWSGHDCIAGFTWDLVRPAARRRNGFPSWSWSGWTGQVKPGLPVKLEHDPSENSFSNRHNPNRDESIIADTQQDILQVNLPNPLEEDITLHIERIDGYSIPYLEGSWQYFNSGAQGLSRFLHIIAWMTPATLSILALGRPKVTLAATYEVPELLECLLTIDVTMPRGAGRPDRPCTAILLAARKPLAEEPDWPKVNSNNGDPDIGEGESNSSWNCLFLIVEDKGDCFERTGLARFLVSYQRSMNDLVECLQLEKHEIRLG